MEVGELLKWLVENQQQQQQQQTQLIQQLTDQQQLVWEVLEQQKHQGAGAMTAPGGPSGAALALPLRLVKMTAEDDPEAFLVTFERVATAAHWPEEQWATLLAPHLTGPAQGAYRGLAAQNALHYHKVKEAILDQAGVTPKTHRQKFRAEKYQPGERPRAVVQRLKEAATRWLDPERRTAAQVVDMIVLDQFLQILPPEGRTWVRRHQPTTLGEAVTIMENYLAAKGEEDRGQGAKNPNRGSAPT
uniref:SCAN box domain-containing protein n=1 Tax=Pelodiscus sinensis TaxID=13735 RepID=K7EYE1_PELSI